MDYKINIHVLYTFTTHFNFNFKGLDTPAKFYTISVKGCNFSYFLFALQHVEALLKRGLLYKERICSQREQILSLQSRPPFQKGGKNNFERVASLESVSIPLKFHMKRTPMPY